VGVGGDDVHLGTGFLESLVVVGSVFDFGGAVEGKSSRHENQDGPFAHQGLLGDFNELAVVKSLSLEGLDLGVDQRHGFSFRGLQGLGTDNDRNGIGIKAIEEALSIDIHY
jgi:hypothetical protein